MKTFETGATRDSDNDKLDFEGFFSSYSLEAYAEYLNKHRKQADGTLRDSDNWQKGMPLQWYMKSAWRHFFDMWKIHRGRIVHDRKTGEVITLKDAACGLLFNVMGYLHEYLKNEERGSLGPYGSLVITNTSEPEPEAELKNRWKSSIWPDSMSTSCPIRFNIVECENCGKIWDLHVFLDCPQHG